MLIFWEILKSLNQFIHSTQQFSLSNSSKTFWSKLSIDLFMLVVESNWNGFKICLIWSVNLQFGWFEKAKNFQKMPWKIIQIQFIRFDSNYRLESNYQILDSFKICLIWFENLQFGWFEKAKNIQKMPWKVIQNSNVMKNRIIYFGMNCLVPKCP